MTTLSPKWFVTSKQVHPSNLGGGQLDPTAVMMKVSIGSRE